MDTHSGAYKSRRPRVPQDAAPEFVIRPRRQFVDEGETAKFKASLEGYPVPKVSWEFQGQTVSNEERFKLYEKSDFHFLEISDAKIEDKGDYTCKAVNSVGKASYSALLEVYEKPKPRRNRQSLKTPPTLEKPLKDVEVKEGSRQVVLECEVSGKPEPMITWYKSLELLGKSENVTQRYDGKVAKLIIKQVSLAEEGSYECVATNTSGEQRTKAVLSVTETKPLEISKPPVITKPLNDITVNDGEKVKFECEVTGTEPLDISWYKDGKEMKLSPDFLISYKEGTASMVIKEVFSEDAGSYKCDVRNKTGKVATRARLVVNETKPVEISKPPVITKPLNDITVDDGEKVRFECDVTGTEPLEISWYKEGKEIKPSPDFLVSYKEGTASIEIKEVLAEDAGSYKCCVKNETGKVATRAKLVVNEKKPLEISKPPVITKPLNDMTVDEGEKVRFECQVTGTEPLDISWHKDGKEIEPSPDFLISDKEGTASMVIKELIAEDAGSYKCNVKNETGKVATRAKLVVNESKPLEIIKPPVITKPLNSITIDGGEKVKFDCEVIGAEPLEISWYKDGKEIKPSPDFLISYKEEEEKIETKQVSEMNIMLGPTTTVPNLSAVNITISIPTSNSNSKPELYESSQNIPVFAVNQSTDNKEVHSDDIVMCEPVYAKTKSNNIHLNQKVESAAANQVKSLVTEVRENVNSDKMEHKPVFAKTKHNSVEKAEHRPVFAQTKSDISDRTVRTPLQGARIKDKHISNDKSKSEELVKDANTKKLIVSKNFEINPKMKSESDGVKTKKGNVFSHEINLKPVNAKQSDRNPIHTYKAENNQMTAGLKTEKLKKIPLLSGTRTNKFETDVSDTTKKSTPSSNISRQTLKTGLEQQTNQKDKKENSTPDRMITSQFKQETKGAKETTEEKPPVTHKFESSIKVNKDIVKQECDMSETIMINKGKLNVQNSKEQLGVTKTKWETNGTYEQENDEKSSVHNKLDSKVKDLEMKDFVGNEPPVIKRLLKDLEVNDGTKVELIVEVEGTPPIDICWLHNEKEIKESDPVYKEVSDGNLYKLIIHEVFPEDGGSYVCEAYNDFGDSETMCNLVVKENNEVAYEEEMYPPAFMNKPQSKTVDEGNCASFSCVVNGNPLPEISWHKDNKNIEHGSRFKLATDGSKSCFEIPHTLATDAGRYSAIATNSQGTAKATASLVVKEIKDAEHSDFRSLLKSRPHLGKIGSQPSVDSESDQIDFRGVLTRHVKTSQRPVFEVPLEDTTVREGKSVILKCKLIGTPEPTITWFIGMKEIKESKFFKMSYENGFASLRIAEAYSEDEGMYTCEATNGGGSTKSTCDLSVQEVGSEMNTSVKAAVNDRVKEKEPEQLDFRNVLKKQNTFDSTRTLEQKKFEADQKDFRGLLKRKSVIDIVGKKEEPTKLEEAKQLDFRNVLRKGSIPKRQEHTSVSSETDTLDFRGVLKKGTLTKQKPSFKKELEDVKVKEGDPLILQCNVTGVPLPSIRWIQQGKEIKASTYFNMTYEGELACLNIGEVFPEDAGEYVCRAFNEAGVVTSACEVFVEELKERETENNNVKSHVHSIITSDITEPPIIEDITPNNIQVVCGGQFKLFAKFAGAPAPNVLWSKGKEEITAGGRVEIENTCNSSTLTVSYATSSDTDKYSMQVKNELGFDSMSASVTVEDRPEPPSGHPHASKVTHKSLILSWYGPSYDGGCQVTDYKVEKKTLPDESWTVLTSDCKSTTFHVKDLQKAVEYQFRVSAANKHGFSEPGLVSEVINTGEGRLPSSSFDELSFEPRHVEITPSRKFEEHYKLHEEIGKGRFGNVYRCVDKQTKKKKVPTATLR